MGRWGKSGGGVPGPDAPRFRQSGRRAVADDSAPISRQRRVGGQESSEPVAQALFAVQGTSVYPDATFSLRVTYGTCAATKRGGTELSPITLLGGAFEHHTGREPFVLPSLWPAAKSRLKAATPLNFVSTLDIIGGNSGSPVLNRDAQVVGLIFDGNLASLGGTFFYDDTANRAVAVHTSGLFEALRGIYGALPLVKELQTAASPPHAQVTPVPSQSPVSASPWPIRSASPGCAASWSVILGM